MVFGLLVLLSDLEADFDSPDDKPFHFISDL